jgi:hypothetical protein
MTRQAMAINEKTTNHEHRFGINMADSCKPQFVNQLGICAIAGLVFF